MLVLLPAMAHSEHRHGRQHGNPEDLEAYIARMEEPERAAWQKPDSVIDALHLNPGDAVCDIGAGPGYFSLRAARAVRAQGRVWAVDVVPRMLEVLRQRIQATQLRNLTPVLALDGDPLLPDGSCDVALIVDTYHHFPDGPAYLRRLARALKKGGRIVNIDFHDRELPVGPPVEHKVAREHFLRDAEAAGLVLAGELTFLPYQYFLVLRPRG
ncbi:MAG TPA: methyltransferase domain-containing protein [Thermoanaerobaculia bacterium]